MTEIIRIRATVEFITHGSFDWGDAADLVNGAKNGEGQLSVPDFVEDDLSMHDAVQQLDYPENWFGFESCYLCGNVGHRETDGTVPEITDCDWCQETICSECYEKTANGQILCKDCNLSIVEDDEGYLMELAMDIAGDESDGVFHAIVAELDGSLDEV